MALGALSGAEPALGGDQPAIARSYAPHHLTPVVRARAEAPNEVYERFTSDQPDAGGDSSTHLVYFVPKGAPDEGLDTNGALANSIRSVRSWFVRETGNLRPRVDVLSTGSYDITFVAGRSEASAYPTLDSIVADVKAAGLTSASKRYLIYAAVDRGEICGESYYPLPGFTERGQYGAVYLDSSARCGARDFGGGSVATAGRADTIAAHEWLHSEGVSPMTSPHYCASRIYHICTGPLWAAPELDPEANEIVFPYITDVLGNMILDRDRDDYLDHSWPWIANLRDSAWLEPVG